MKPLVKKALKPVWRATAPLRRPFLLRVDAYLRRCLSVSVPAEHTGVVLDHVVRELVRLQDQVEVLRLTIEELVHERDNTGEFTHRKAS